MLLLHVHLFGLINVQYNVHDVYPRLEIFNVQLGHDHVSDRNVHPYQDILVGNFLYYQKCK